MFNWINLFHTLRLWIYALKLQVLLRFNRDFRSSLSPFSPNWVFISLRDFRFSFHIFLHISLSPYISLIVCIGWGVLHLLCMTVIRLWLAIWVECIKVLFVLMTSDFDIVDICWPQAHENRKRLVYININQTLPPYQQASGVGMGKAQKIKFVIYSFLYIFTQIMEFNI